MLQWVRRLVQRSTEWSSAKVTCIEVWKTYLTHSSTAPIVRSAALCTGSDTNTLIILICSGLVVVDASCELRTFSRKEIIKAVFISDGASCALSLLRRLVGVLGDVRGE